MCVWAYGNLYIYIPGAVDNINIMESGIISEIITWNYLEIISVSITQRIYNNKVIVVSFRLPDVLRVFHGFKYPRLMIQLEKETDIM